MSARTPGPWTVVTSAVAQRFDLRNETTGAIWNRALKNSAACELAATKNEVERLTAQRDALADLIRRYIAIAPIVPAGDSLYVDALALLDKGSERIEPRAKARRRTR